MGDVPQVGLEAEEVVAWRSRRLAGSKANGSWHQNNPNSCSSANTIPTPCVIDECARERLTSEVGAGLRAKGILLFPLRLIRPIRLAGPRLLR